jgi:hypothetical protein
MDTYICSVLLFWHSPKFRETSKYLLIGVLLRQLAAEIIPGTRIEGTLLRVENRGVILYHCYVFIEASEPSLQYLTRAALP